MKPFKILMGVFLSFNFCITMPSFSQSPAKPAPVIETTSPVLVWPGIVPGEKGNIGEEKDKTKSTDNKVSGKDVIRLTNVTKPTLTVYSPPKNKRNGSAVIVCPGGGYSILAMDLEGTEICEWLNSIGVTALLLKYRVPVREGLSRYQPPLQDAQRAMGLVRANAGKLGIDPNRIGIMGFSAGAHLSAALSTNYDKRTYEALDASDIVSCRPDFVMLIYPAYLSLKQEGDKVAPELPISKNTAPTFIVQTEDDPVRVESSLFYYLALKNAGVPAEMHLFASGGHGYGLRKSTQPVNSWPKRAEEWMKTLEKK
ncbi:MAG: alpha/beta hydrolase fold domain-containing protein [Chitinophagaceae bacterium]